MVTYNRLEFTQKAISSIRKHTTFPYVLTVADNNSQDGSKDYLKSLHSEGIIKNLILLKKNIGIAGASNMAWQSESRAQYYLKYDNDIVVKKKNWLKNMVDDINHIPFLGAVGYNFEPKSYPSNKINGHTIRILQESNIGGACILIPKKIRELIGYWCEDYGLYGEEDFDYCYRLKLSGKLCAYMKDENIGIHLPSGKAAEIDQDTYIAKDGIEEIEQKEYRKFKDNIRKDNISVKKLIKKNFDSYKCFTRSLYVQPKKKNLISKNKLDKYMLGRAVINHANLFKGIKNSNINIVNNELDSILHLYKITFPSKNCENTIKNIANSAINAKTKIVSYLYLAEIEDKLEKHKSNKYYISKAIDLLNKSKWNNLLDIYNIASLLKNIGSIENAKKQFESIAYNKSNSKLKSGACFHLGEIELKKRNKDSALRLFKKSLQYNKEHKKSADYIEELTKNAKVSIIIPVFNKIKLTKTCIESVIKNTKKENYEIIVINNGSTDETEKELESFIKKTTCLQIIKNKENTGFARACNQGVRISKGKYIVFLNNDVEAKKGWLQPLLETAENDKKVAAVGSKLLFPDGKIQHAGLIFLEDKRLNDKLLCLHLYYKKPSGFKQANQQKVYHALTAACLLVKKDVFKKLGGFNEKYWNGMEDIDFCVKLRKKGYRAVYQPKSVLTHHESQSGIERFKRLDENRKVFLKRWQGKIHSDYIRNEDGPFIRTRYSPIKNYMNGNNKTVGRIEKESNQLKESLIPQDCLYRINYDIADSYEKKRDKTMRNKYLKKSLKILDKKKNKQSVEIYMMASIYKRLFDYKRSLLWFKKLFNMKSVSNLIPGVYYHLGEIDLHKKNFKNAKICFNRCLNLNKNHLKAKERLEQLKC